VRAWRIAVDAPDYGADDVSGAGAFKSGGRWNRPGRAVLYCADSPALACLETLAHLAVGSLPLNRYLVAIDVPDAVWKAREHHAPATLPVGWDAIPTGKVSLDFGDAWLDSRRTCVLRVPSSIVPEDGVILIDPAHPDAAAITAAKLRKWLYDPRVRP
jgi:RES domain-containing protein